jgi:hypothetical protein
MFDRVFICTARKDLGAVKDFCRKNGWSKYISGYTNRKLPAKLIVDDMAVKHQGNLKDTLKEVENFKAHWEEKEGGSEKNPPKAVPEKT